MELRPWRSLHLTGAKVLHSQENLTDRHSEELENPRGPKRPVFVCIIIFFTTHRQPMVSCSIFFSQKSKLFFASKPANKSQKHLKIVFFASVTDWDWPLPAISITIQDLFGLGFDLASNQELQNSNLFFELGSCCLRDKQWQANKHWQLSSGICWNFYLHISYKLFQRFKKFCSNLLCKSTQCLCLKVEKCK